MILIFDLETDGLELTEMTTIHTLCIYDPKMNVYTRYDKQEVKNGVKRLHEADAIVGHNIINFDVPVIKHFYSFFSPKKVIDTLVWARLVYADIFDVDKALVKKRILPSKLTGSHSLKAYGYRLGELKGGFAEETDWQEWSEEMSEYCEQDVRVTKLLYEKLLKRNVSSQAIELEHKVAEIIKRQVDWGFNFDIKEAEALYLRLLQRREELKETLTTTFGQWIEPNGTAFTPKCNNKNKGVQAGCPYQKLKVVEFNPNSRQHIAKRLKALYNWKPKEFTDGGQPKINDEILDALPYPEAKLLAEYLMIQKRISQISEGNSGWLKMVDTDSRIRGQVITNGAVTGRMTHMKPNIAQVPAVRVPYGTECRALFKPSEGWLQVGCDASGLELRCLAHYMARYDKGAYAKEILEGDIHTANQLSAGLPTRDDAKTFIYAFLYGAGDEKIGSIVGGTRKEGRKLKNAFLKKTPALAQLKNQVEATVKGRGYLIGLDGRPLKVRSAHSALNTLLQSAGALIMKQGLVFLDNDLKAENLKPGQDYEFMANIHDEWQLDVRPEIAERVGEIAVKAIIKAGEYFKFRCPLDGEYKVGKNWADTH